MTMSTDQRQKFRMIEGIFHQVKNRPPPDNRSTVQYLINRNTKIVHRKNCIPLPFPVRIVHYNTLNKSLNHRKSQLWSMCKHGGSSTRACSTLTPRGICAHARTTVPQVKLKRSISASHVWRTAESMASTSAFHELLFVHQTGSVVSKTPYSKYHPYYNALVYYKKHFVQMLHILSEFICV